MRKMEKANYIKALCTAIFSFLSSLLGVLALPVILMVTCNCMDFMTGLMAAKYRGQKLEANKCFRGLAKKVCMWLLVVVGAVIDQLIIYTCDTVGYNCPLTFLVACIVAIWIICTEIISILENAKDIGVEVPFLEPLIKNIRSQVEDKANISTDSKGE